jgi:hypothetical protein
MTPMSFRVAFAPLASLAALSAALVAAEPPLAARLVSGTQPSVELRNTGSRAVTAWSFAVSSPNANGGIHREGHFADVYLSEATRGLPQAPNHLDWLRPGESRTIPVDAAPQGATVEVLAVIFDDATAWGDAKTVKEFFDKRAAERDELEKVVATFEAVLPAQKGTAALEELNRRFAAGAGAAESTPHRSAREAVAAFLQRAKAPTPEDTEQALRTYVDFVRKQRDLAVKHAQQRG